MKLEGLSEALKGAATPEQACQAVAEILTATPGFYDVAVWNPERTAELGWGSGWSICCEGGPFEWTIALSMTEQMLSCSGWIAEPYNHFVLNFNED